MKFYALFDGSSLVAGPQSVDPGDWTEVTLDDVPPGVITEWDFSGDLPRRRAKVLSSDEIASAKAIEVRERRRRLLNDSDWTDTYSAPARLGQDVYQSWQDYRQALRDVTSQPGFPLDVAWPTPPTT